MVFIPSLSALQIMVLGRRTPDAEILATFYLAALKPGCGYESAGLFASPNPAPAPTDACWYEHGDEMLRGDGIAVAIVDVVKDCDGLVYIVETLDLVVRLGPLQELCRRRFADWCSGHPRSPLVLRWSEWGPHYARFFEYSVVDHRMGSVSGFRAGRAVPILDVHHDFVTATRIHVHDFNPYAMARHRSSMSNRGLDSVLPSRTEEPTSRFSRPTPHDMTNWARWMTRSERDLPVFLPDPGACTTHVVTSPFTRWARRSEVYAEDVYCAMPYRITSRTIPDDICRVFVSCNNLIMLVRH